MATAKKNSELAEKLKRQAERIDLLTEELRETKDSIANIKKLCRRLLTLVSIRKLDSNHESITNSSMKFVVGDGGDAEELTWWDIPSLKEKYGASVHKKGKTQRKCEVCHRDTVYVCRCCCDINRMVWVCQPVDDRNLTGKSALNRAKRWRENRGLSSSAVVDIKDINHCWLKHTAPDFRGHLEEDLNDLLSSSSDEHNSSAVESNSNSDADGM